MSSSSSSSPPPPPTSGTSGVKSSFDAFSKVDSIVSKPVLGSDGAASWQEFKKDVNNKQVVINSHRSSTAPKAPLKKLDRLGAGFATWEEERLHEKEIRQKSGHVETGSGYTTFKKKNSAEEAVERKRIKNIEARIRPEEKEYFIKSSTFQGWKFDYIFTTRPDRGTGYFWDGTDSIKQLRGELPQEEEEKRDTTQQQQQEMGKKKGTGHDGVEKESEDVKQHKKKKRKKNDGPVIISDPNNPMEQVAAILQRRNQQLLGMGGATLPVGWEATRDAGTGNIYYFNRVTGERSWTVPTEPKEQEDDKGGGAGNEESDGSTKVSPLPEGWNVAVDKTSGKNYYFHTNGETRWDRPTVT